MSDQLENTEVTQEATTDVEMSAPPEVDAGSMLSGAESSAPVEQSAPATGDFRSGLDESLRDDPSLSDIKNVNDLAKSYVNAQRMIGSSIRIPGEDAGDEQREEFYRKLQDVPGVAKLPQNEEEWGHFYNKMGRPENPAGYEYEFPEGVPVDEEVLHSFSDFAHKLGLTKAQAKAVTGFQANWIASTLQQDAVATEQARQSNEAILKEKWGPEFNNKLSAAKIVASQYSEKYPDQVAELASGPAGNNAAFLSILSDLYSYMSEDGLISETSRPGHGPSSEEAQQTIEEIKGNPNHAYWNPSDPGHDAAIKKVNELYQIAYPGAG